MKVTKNISIDDSVLELAKELCKERAMTFSALITQLILQETKKSENKKGRK